jgi:hypothetical protein
VIASVRTVVQALPKRFEAIFRLTVDMKCLIYARTCASFDLEESLEEQRV